MNEPDDVQRKSEEALGESVQSVTESDQGGVRPLLEPSIAHVRIIATLVAVVALLVAAFMRCG